ncbi:MAG: GNAT family N-acetyltransferase, partial [Bacillota bacterium]
MSIAEIRPASVEDLLGIARVFSQAFPDSLIHTFGRIPEPDFVSEAFRVCLDAEPGAFFVAHSEGQVVGYAFTPARLSNLWRTAIINGHVWRWISSTLTGRFRLGWHPVRTVLSNKGSFFASALDRRYAIDARILSIAVMPDYQGQGIAGGLLDHGLSYLRAQNVSRVRLEVRPTNIPA